MDAAGGGVSAAKACGMLRSRSLLYGLRDQERSELTEETIAKLQKGFDAYGVPAKATDYVSSPSQARAQTEYDRWLAHWAERIVLEPEYNAEKTRLLPSPARRRELERLVSRTRRLLSADLEKFVQFAAVQRGHSPERIAIAAYRVFEPLLEVRVSGYAEVGGEELNDEEFRRFVRNGLSRERILLGRAPDLQRLRNREGREIQMERLELTNSENQFVRMAQSRGFKRKRPNIADALAGRVWPRDYPIELRREDVTRWIPRECWEVRDSPSTLRKRSVLVSAIDRKRERERVAREVENARHLADAKAKRARRKS